MAFLGQAFIGALDVDEVIAQLLTSEGFATLDEVAYVELHELSDIEGFDEDTAQELQTRAREYLEAAEAANEAKRNELGVTDELAAIEGITSAMLVAFGENDVKSMEDLAGCAADDLTGWFEVVDGERKKMDGILEGFDVTNIDRLNDTLDKLTPKQKEVIFLKFYEQLSYAEIAQIMKVEVKAIYKLMARAIGSLRSDFINLFLFL